MKRGKRGSVMREIESKLRSGKSPKELIRMGYSKSTVYEVYKRLRKKTDIDTITVFRLLNEGKSIVEIVTEVHIDPQRAEKIFDQWASLKRKEIEARRELNELPKADQGGYEVLVKVARYVGELKRSQCSYYSESGGYCLRISEKRAPPGLENLFIYDPKRERYFANVLENPLFCAFCGLFEVVPESPEELLELEKIKGILGAGKTSPPF